MCNTNQFSYGRIFAIHLSGDFLFYLGITSFRIDGKTTLKERVKMIDKFNKDKPSQSSSVEEGKCLRGSVFLVSMKAGGCGLNLVAASTVFIIDPW